MVKIRFTGKFSRSNSWTSLIKTTSLNRNSEEQNRHLECVRRFETIFLRISLDKMRSPVKFSFILLYSVFMITNTPSTAKTTLNTVKKAIQSMEANVGKKLDRIIALLTKPSQGKPGRFRFKNHASEMTTRGSSRTD